jgi:hypothetical protein
MGKLVFTLPNTTRRVVTGIAALLMTTQAMAAAVITLEGTTPDAMQESKASLKLSILEWSDEDQREAVINGFKAWKESGETEAFVTLLNKQETQGYLFTGEVTGYSVKYSAQHDDDLMSLLIIPGLKTKNRYLWQPAAPEEAPPFTLLELRPNEDSTELFTSLDGEIVSGDEGLRLNEGEHAVFGTLRDATPYYLRQGN